LPVADRSIDAALFLLSAHELRTERSRAELFGEVARVLAKDGRVVVAEHLRDWPNFVGFGPGFLHFHSRRTWRRCFDRAKLAIEREFHITPFVGVFVLRRAA
jgi:ubiquinone/menaquinone biosynthesis C-methylase UbiE